MKNSTISSTISSAKSSVKIPLILLTIIVSLFLIYKYESKELAELHLSGDTMGTYYSVKVVGEQAQLNSLPELQTELEALLIDINRQMSSYDTQSELSQFNQLQSLSPKLISDDFAHVVKAALYISEQSQGAFDITLGPLVNLWGFGPQARPEHIPSQELIAQLKQKVGYQYLQVQATNGENLLSKALPDLYVDLSAIAKGFAVDKLSEHMDKLGFSNYLVDIGGEIRVKGKNKQGNLWRIAVEKPQAEQRTIQIKLALSDVAIATSGDYRNYFESDGIRYSHTIDGQTGKPIAHTLVSATVVHQNCMMADGYATALMVLGPVKGLEFAKALHLPVLLISKTADGFSSEMTQEMQVYLFK